MPHTVLRLPTVKARTGLSRSTIYLRVSRGALPVPVSLGGRAVGWIEAEVNAWLTAQIKKRRGLRHMLIGDARVSKADGSHLSARRFRKKRSPQGIVILSVHFSECDRNRSGLNSYLPYPP